MRNRIASTFFVIACWPALLHGQETCLIRGRVVDAQTGDAIRKAEVRLLRYRPNLTASPGPIGSGTTRSDASGNFCLTGKVEPGDYLMVGQRTGYLNTRFGAIGPELVGTVLTITAGQSFDGIRLALIPQAVITGRVVDADGEPLSGQSVRIWRETWVRGKKHNIHREQTQTDDRGEFRLPGLAPGRYFLSAQPTMFNRFGNSEMSDHPSPRPVKTFYPNALTLQSATALELKTGQRLSGIEIQMISAMPVQVRGQLTGDLWQMPLKGSYLSLQEDNFGLESFSVGLGENGSFELSQVTPGTLRIFVGTPKQGRMPVVPRTIDVGTTDIDGLVVKFVPLFH